MRHTGRTMFAALLAVLAFGALAAASASAALPEFAMAKGESFPVTLEGTSTNESSFRTYQGWDFMPCKGVHTTGTITAAKAVSLKLELTGCAVGNKTWKTEGAKPGDVVIPATGSLVYIKKSTKTVGLLITLTETEANCEGSYMIVKGTLVAPVSPVNTKTSKLELLVKETGTGVQEIKEYENEKGEVKRPQLYVNYEHGWDEGALQMGLLGLTASKAVTIEG